MFAVVNWMSSYARFCASMVVARVCVLSLTGCQVMLVSVVLWLLPRVCVLSLTGCQAMLSSVLLWL